MRENLDGWREDLLSDLPQARVEAMYNSWPDAFDLIKVAAYNRRLYVPDFVGRAALAVAVFDSAGEHSWREMTRAEPPLRDLRRINLPMKRRFGEGFGPWDIKEMQ
jgi:hypothetical protein